MSISRIRRVKLAIRLESQGEFEKFVIEALKALRSFSGRFNGRSLILRGIDNPIGIEISVKGLVVSIEVLIQHNDTQPRSYVNSVLQRVNEVVREFRRLNALLRGVEVSITVEPT